MLCHNLNTRGNARALGPRTADLLSQLMAEGRLVFSTRDVERHTGVSTARARSLARDLVDRNLAVRLKSSLYSIVPFEYREVADFAPNAYLVARALAEPHPYYLSHRTAMEIHRMTTQPQLSIFICCTRRKKNEVLFGTEYRFILRQRQAIFGTMKHWVAGGISVEVSDPERTIVDGLAEPEHAGGIPEVAKAIQIDRSNLDINRLVEYAKRLQVKAVVRRLGYLLELYSLAPAELIERLRSDLGPSIEILDPTLPREGRFMRRWGLHLNVSSEELLAVAAT
jgi:predicted transcriptional regulator of viral defense system